MQHVKKQKKLLPITPTAKPSPDDIVKVASAAVVLTQSCLLSPSAVIASLRASLDLYAQHAINRGFDPKTVEECEKLGQAVAKAVLESGLVKGPKVERMPLVDASGNPIAPDGAEDDAEVEQEGEISG